MGEIYRCFLKDLLSSLRHNLRPWAKFENASKMMNKKNKEDVYVDDPHAMNMPNITQATRIVLLFTILTL